MITRAMLILTLLTTTIARADVAVSTQQAIVDAVTNCLGRDGIARFSIVSIRVDGSAAQVRYAIGDAGQATTYLAYSPERGWSCVGGTGGVASPTFYSRMSTQYRAYHVNRSATQIRALAQGKRGLLIKHPTGIIVTPVRTPYY